jgi:hypothetical protein
MMSILHTHFFTRLATAAILTAALPGVAWAQRPASPLFFHGSAGVPIPETGTFTQSASVPLLGETASHHSQYEAPSGLFLDGGGGFLFSPWLGGAVSFSRSGGSKPADFSLTRPHPLLFNALVTRDSTSQSLDQVQRSFHLSAVITPNWDVARNYDLKLFVGPSRIYVDQELITAIDISESLQGAAYDFTIDRPVISDGKVCACAWGFHVAADASRYLSPRFGLGAMVRYSRATVQLQNAARLALGAGDGTVDYVAGGFTIAGGIRLRLGMWGSESE